MITITKQNDGVLFAFQDSDKYLYGNGSILVPFNTLSIVADESDMITLKKAASNDVFLSARYDTDFGYRSKDDAIDDLKGMLFAETGGGSESGITSGEVQTMIDNSLEDYYTDDEVDAAISGKADTSAVTAVANDVQTVSGQVQTKVATSDFNAYSAATATALGNKQDALVYYSENTEEGYAEMKVTTDDGNGNTSEEHISIGGGFDMGNYQEYNDGQGNTGFTSTQIMFVNPELYMYAESEDNGENEATHFHITPLGVTINYENVATEPYVDAAISGKADTSAVTAVNDALTAHTANTTVHVTQVEKDAWNAKVDTSVIITAITSGSTDAQVPTAKATYDAIQAGGGGMDDDTQQLISTALNDLNDRKADLTELSKYQKKGDYVETPTLSDYMTNASFDEYATAKERIISGALNDLNDKFGGLRLVKISQTDYDNLATKDGNTLYIINNVI